MTTKKNRVLKRVFIVFSMLIAVAIIFRLFFYNDLKEWVSLKVKVYLTEIEYGELQINDLDISVFHHFPDVSLQLNQLDFYESKFSANAASRLPILHADKFNLAFNSWELLWNRKLVVTKLEFENGLVNLSSNQNGKLNIENAFQSKDTVKVETKDSNNKNQELSIDLQTVSFTDFEVAYEDHTKIKQFQIDVEKLSGDLLINKKGLSVNLNSDFEIIKSSQFPVFGTLGTANLHLNIDANHEFKEITIHDGNIQFETISADLKGRILNNDEKYVDVKFDASSNNFPFLSKIIKKEVLVQNHTLINKADLILKGQIKGPINNSIPKIDMNFRVNDLSLVVPNSKIKFRNIGFDGEFHSGDADDFSEADFALRNLRGSLPGGTMSGHVALRNFVKPSLKTNMNLSIDLYDFDKVFHLSSIDSLRGKLAFISEFSGEIPVNNRRNSDNIRKWFLSIKDVQFNYVPANKKVQIDEGKIEEIKDEISLQNLSLKYGNSDLSINGRIQNLFQYFFNKSGQLETELSLKSSAFYTSDFIVNPNKKAAIDDRISSFICKSKIFILDRNPYDTLLPKMKAEVKQLSFDLDSLPGINNLSGEIDFVHSAQGYGFLLEGVNVDLPLGNLKVESKVHIPQDFRSLSFDTELNLKDLPVDYIEDLIIDISDLGYLHAKQKKKDELILVNGELQVESTLEFYPFSTHSSVITSDKLELNSQKLGGFGFTKLNVLLEDLSFLRNRELRVVTGIKTLHGKIEADSIHIPSIKGLPALVEVNGINDKIKIDFGTSKIKNLNDKGVLNLDFTKKDFVFDLSYENKGISANTLLSDYTENIGVDGDFYTSIRLSAMGKTFEEIRKSVDASIEISSDSLVFYGIDLDDILQKYNRSQKFNLTDVSAYMIAGPFGAVVTKGSDFTNLMVADLKRNKKTNVTKLLTRWKLNNGILQSNDVAFRTKMSRLAFDGSLDIEKDSIPGLTVYVVDKNGCSLMQQTLRGKTNDLQTGRLKIAKTLLGSVINAVKSVAGSECEIVYEGEVSHPIISKKNK